MYVLLSRTHAEWVDTHFVPDRVAPINMWHAAI